MELKFDDTEEEKYIVSYLLKDQLFFLKVSKYLATRDWTSKQYFQDAKLQFILNSAIKYQEKYKSPITEASLKILARKTCKDDDHLLQKTISVNTSVTLLVCWVLSPTIVS